MAHVMALRCVSFTCFFRAISVTLNQSLMSGVVLCLTNSALLYQQKAMRLFETTLNLLLPADGEAFRVFSRIDWSVLTMWCEQLVCECKIAI